MYIYMCVSKIWVQSQGDDFDRDMPVGAYQV